MAGNIAARRAGPGPCGKNRTEEDQGLILEAVARRSGGRQAAGCRLLSSYTAKHVTTDHSGERERDRQKPASYGPLPSHSRVALDVVPGPKASAHDARCANSDATLLCLGLPWSWPRSRAEGCFHISVVAAVGMVVRWRVTTVGRHPTVDTWGRREGHPGPRRTWTDVGTWLLGLSLFDFAGGLALRERW